MRRQLLLLLLATCLHHAGCWRGPVATAFTRHAPLRCSAPAAPDANEETLMSRKKKRIKIAKRQPKQRKRDSKDDPARSGVTLHVIPLSLHVEVTRLACGRRARARYRLSSSTCPLSTR